MQKRKWGKVVCLLFAHVDWLLASVVCNLYSTPNCKHNCQGHEDSRSDLRCDLIPCLTTGRNLSVLIAGDRDSWNSKWVQEAFYVENTNYSQTGCIPYQRGLTLSLLVINFPEYFVRDVLLSSINVLNVFHACQLGTKT